MCIRDRVYEARKIVEDANGGDYAKGLGFGFFQNNTVLDPSNKGKGPVN